MGRYTNLPTLAVDFLKPARMSFDRKGAGQEGGRNGLGESVSIETSGGGILVGSYVDCFVQAREEHDYLNWVSARMNGSFRFMVVPILSDWMGPFPVNAINIPQPIISGIPHSDGALFSDDSGYSQATVFGTMGAKGRADRRALSHQKEKPDRAFNWDRRGNGRSNRVEQVSE